MHVHFANLIDNELTNIIMANGILRKYSRTSLDNKIFPAINDDMLLYLVVLGGFCPTYYDIRRNKNYSCKYMFEETKAFHSKTILPSDLLEEYPENIQLLKSKMIPFLALQMHNGQLAFLNKMQMDANLAILFVPPHQ
ncbi:hypothetical protein THRCLA_22957 [Thraustotheca clavata]|uniref:Crinkler (CRN) family protein n=1 Tax=Thraustotheca clavata TaxID=74557 RepID=A0A1V9YLI6_9STRA|nr:hypothetical protein THRCLA_22957 [Thraustotheca clavata]